MTRTMRQAERARKKKHFEAISSGARSSSACITERRDTGSNVLFSRHQCQCTRRLMELLTFAGGLTAGPGAVGEADPLSRAVERVTRGAGEAHFSVLLKAALLSRSMGRRARIPTAAPFITCGHSMHKHTILHTLSQFFFS